MVYCGFIKKQECTKLIYSIWTQIHLPAAAHVLPHFIATINAVGP